MKLTDYYDFTSVVAEVHSCLAPDRNLLAFGDVGDPIWPGKMPEDELIS